MPTSARPPRQPVAAALTAALPALVAALLAPPAALAQATINGCSAQAVSACGYASPDNFTPAVVDAYLEDPSRGNHPVPIRVRYPVGATGARPVVIWNHGGGTTNVDSQATAAAGFTVTRGQQSSVRRSESFARAGYVVIHIGRMEPRSLTPAQLQDCLTAGVIVGGIVNPSASALANCRTWTGFHLYGPRNIAFVAALLAGYQRGMLPGFDGMLDREKIVVGGWSGGTQSSLNIAGAYQRWSGPGAVGGPAVVQQPVVVPGVAAFFLDAPRGPEWAGFNSGFQEDSSYGIDARPILFNTARDDRSDSGPPVARNVHYFGSARAAR